MKRSRIFLIVLTLSLVFALPAYGSGDLVSDGWTWNEATKEVAPAPDAPTPDGWTWDEALSADGWTWDEAASTPSG
jgi:hypothetical protein